MPPFPSHLRLTPSRSLSRAFSRTLPLPRPAEHPFPILPKCPPSTCACAPMPTLTPKIDHSRSLANTIPPYTQHIVIPTGQYNWPSRIENSPPTTPWGALTARLKRELGPRGNAFDPYNPVLITTSSFTPAPSPSHASKSSDSSSILLFPIVSEPSPLPPNLRKLFNSSEDTLPSTPMKIKTESTTLTILICSHNNRDSRCGTLGPILQAEFVTQLSNVGLKANTGVFDEAGEDTVNVGCISHVGGHAWAGNVIVYMPVEGGHALGGTGIWYGRVEPRHVEGIVKETILGGRVIGELWRGGIGRDGKVMRI